MKIATWNVNSIRTRKEHISTWLETYSPDVLAVQETKVVDEDFPTSDFESLGYRLYFTGQKSYNGVAIFSKCPGQDFDTTFPGYDESQRRFLALTVDDVRIVNVYVPNGSDIGTQKFEYKIQWLNTFTQWAHEEVKKNTKMIILGDFNIAPDDIDVYDPQSCADQILCSGEERDSLSNLMGDTFHDVFRDFCPGVNGFSWWDYRYGAFRNNRGFRIDLILATKSLVSECQHCEVDREPRMLEKPSDHAPVFARFSPSS